MKYKILKAIDISGLNFLSPVVRLIAQEDPRKQLHEIGRFIIVPIVAFAAFLFLWSALAPKHRTKAGEVPTPGVVWDASKGVWLFHKRETAKADAYLMNSAERRKTLQQATTRLARLDALEAEANRQISDIKAASKEKFDAYVAPSKTAYDAKRAEFRTAKINRENSLKEKAALLATQGTDARIAYLARIRENAVTTEQEKEQLKLLKTTYTEAQTKTFPEVKKAQQAITKLAEERQFLSKYSEMLGAGSRESKTTESESLLAESKNKFLTATDGDFYRLGNTVVKSEDLLATTETSHYAKPWTLPKQIVRSLLCVFTGFLVASAIAIPIGILCGLSPTFMAAMTPFIALFKPVSPLVWLPIIMIIVGGFMPEPENHWLVKALDHVPILKNYKVDPMFLSSALTVALCSLWATLVNTALGVASIEKDHLNVAKVLRLGFTARLFKIVIPTALPLIFAGLRISLAVGWMVLVAAEILSTSQGIGKFVNDMYTNGSSESFAQMFVVVFIVGIIGMFLDRIMIIFQRLVSFDTAGSAI
ncbi:MAG: ABC transporter permease subunit [Armatimonadetes bacterium]|nr:ABC transporter permease subunit [Akkermansiaceae bacterium]